MPDKAPVNNNPLSSGMPVLRAITFKEVFGSRLFIIATGLAALAYLSFFKYLDLATGTGVMADPNYYPLFYSLVAVSSVLMGLTVYSLRSRLASRRGGTKLNTTFGSSSAATSVMGSLISCSCHTAILLPLLTSLGIGAISGIGIITAMVVYQLWILAVFIVLDAYLIYRVLAKIQRAKAQAAADTVL